MEMVPGAPRPLPRPGEIVMLPPAAPLVCALPAAIVMLRPAVAFGALSARSEPAGAARDGETNPLEKSPACGVGVGCGVTVGAGVAVLAGVAVATGVAVAA